MVQELRGDGSDHAADESVKRALDGYVKIVSAEELGEEPVSSIMARLDAIGLPTASSCIQRRPQIRQKFASHVPLVLSRIP